MLPSHSKLSDSVQMWEKGLGLLDSLILSHTAFIFLSVCSQLWVSQGSTKVKICYITQWLIDFSTPGRLPALSNEESIWDQHTEKKREKENERESEWDREREREGRWEQHTLFHSIWVTNWILVSLKLQASTIRSVCDDIKKNFHCGDVFFLSGKFWSPH